MAGIPDDLYIYSDFNGTQATGYLGTYEIPVGFSGDSINNIMSSLGVGIPQGANGFTLYYSSDQYLEYGLNDTIPGTLFHGSGTAYEGWFTYPPETITGFFLNGTEYKIGGDEAAWGNISGTLSDQTDLNTALSGKADKTEILEYNAGEGIEIKNGLDYSAMQGPAPDRFHVPSVTEWQAVYNIRIALGGGDEDGINFGIALKLPMAGLRRHWEGDVSNQGSYGEYWSSSIRFGNTAYNTFFASGDMNIGGGTTRTRGLSIRCFKNSPTVPTSSWTKLYGTSIESGGIFWSSANGLISLSSDGQTWITIADKNLGATTVWNNGDTLSETNCGKYYQWGNNYGFPRTGSVTTSSTQVDASNYGPGNYYSSNTFITADPWDSSDNGNLWGGETGVVSINNAITNTGVLSVNGQTGDVTVASPDMSNYLAKDNTTAFTPSADYHPATKKYVDDNAGKEYNAGEGIEIKNGLDYSAMQGPAPDGFHVPLNTEWQAVVDAYTGLGLSGSDNFRIYLKMPLAGYRNYSNSSVKSQGAYGYYWSSSSYTSDYAYILKINPTALYPQSQDRRTYGYPVRCLKNSPVTPDSSWTTLYDGSSIATGAGIFHNATDGLISISSDGTTWYTIQDKNLGATTLYNDGDTLSEANCGTYFQWGNNYGFAWTGSITTSSTQVDASGYGPGNYYSSSTFITGYDDWSSVHNNNLWGGETGIVTLNNAITNTGVLSVNGQTGNVTIPEPNVIAVTQAEYDALPEATKNDGKLRIISDAPQIEIPVPDDTAFGSSWDGDTTHAPSKNAVYDAIGNIETLLAAL